MIKIVWVEIKDILENKVKVNNRVSYLLSALITHSPIFMWIGAGDKIRPTIILIKINANSG